MPLGITNTKLKFTLARGTDHECVVELHAIMVDTTAYDVIPGMEFVSPTSSWDIACRSRNVSGTILTFSCLYVIQSFRADINP